jgi:hypothetical protein
LRPQQHFPQFLLQAQEAPQGSEDHGVDGRRIISPDAEREWRLERERDAAEAACRLSPHAANPTKDE